MTQILRGVRAALGLAIVAAIVFQLGESVGGPRRQGWSIRPSRRLAALSPIHPIATR